MHSQLGNNQFAIIILSSEKEDESDNRELKRFLCAFCTRR